MTIKYTITADISGAVERLEIGKHTFERAYTSQEFGLLSGDDDISEQAADAGFRDDIANNICDAVDGLNLVLDLVYICEDLEEEE